ncbi:MAG: hypothetical protein E5W86_28995, partial [Mesorhizobium sp.]
KARLIATEACRAAENGVEFLERVDGAVHRRLAEPAGGGQPLAQPDDAREGIDDAELAVARRHRDQQPAIVGAEIERGEDRQFVLRRTRPTLHRPALHGRWRRGWCRLRGWRTGAGRRLPRCGDLIVVAGENLAAAPAFAALAGLA